jgi:nitrogenase molybdenum-iron protein NifN
MIGVATTCLTETIGDDVPMILREFRNEFRDLMRDLMHEQGAPDLVSVSTPSYSGTHMEGFYEAVRALVDQLATTDIAHDGVNLLPGFVSPADARYLSEIMTDFGLEATILPDMSLTLDAPALADYERIPSGGTPVEAIKATGGAKASLEFGSTLAWHASAGKVLRDKFQVPLYSLGAPIGLRETDRFFEVLEQLSGRETPQKHALERGRLVDAYIDGHKYAFEKRAVIFGEEDLVVGLTAFLAEIGIKPVLCASGGRSGHFKEAIDQVISEFAVEPPIVREGVDFHDIAEEAEALEPELLLGNSKGYHLARRWNIPLIRVGFPIHDRFGGHRTLHVGYRGTQALLDRVINAIIEQKQESTHIGYGYI